jgi:hypothetical protein
MRESENNDRGAFGTTSATFSLVTYFGLETSGHIFLKNITRVCNIELAVQA